MSLFTRFPDASGARLALVVAVAIAALVFGGLAAFAGSSPAPLTVHATSLGTLEPSKDLQLNFEAGGRIAHLYVQPGDHVVAGEILAQLDPTQAQASLQTAVAGLDAAKAQLAQLKTPLTSAEKRQDTVAKQQADAAVAQTKNGLTAARRNERADRQANQAAVDSASNKVTETQRELSAAQQALASAASSVADLKSQIANVQSQIDGDNAQQASLQSDLAVLQAKLAAARDNNNTSGVQSLDDQITSTQQSLALVNEDLTKQQGALDSLGSRLADAKDAYADARTEVATAQSKLDQATQAAQAAQETLRTTGQADASAVRQASDALSNARLGVSATTAGNAVKAEKPRSGDLKSAEATVKTAEASVETSKAALAATVLRAPTSGTVAAVNGDVGEVIQGGGVAASRPAAPADGEASAAALPSSGGAANGGPATDASGESSPSTPTSTSPSSASSPPSASGSEGQPGGGEGGSSPAPAGNALITLVDTGTFDVTATFSGADVSHVAPGETARVEMPDAGVTLTARVTSVEPLPASSQGGGEYPVHFALDGTDSALRAGMTAKVTVVLSP